MSKQTFLHEARKHLPDFSPQHLETERTTAPLVEDTQESARYARILSGLGYAAFVCAGAIGILTVKAMNEHLGVPFDTTQLPPLYDMMYQIARVAHAISQNDTLAGIAGTGLAVSTGIKLNIWSHDIYAENIAAQQQSPNTFLPTQEPIDTNDIAYITCDTSDELYADQIPLVPYTDGYRSQQP